jgi:hypothetical protein
LFDGEYVVAVGGVFVGSVLRGEDKVEAVATSDRLRRRTSLSWGYSRIRRWALPARRR